MMKITIAKDEAEFDRLAAWRIIGEILSNPKAVIGLSTGQTTKNMHAIVSEIYQQYPFKVSNITFFNVDELTNLPRTYNGSCYAIIKKQIINPLGIKEENFLMPSTFSDDFVAECKNFQQSIEKRSGISLQMLGLGYNSHIGINQPGTPFESETWMSPMDKIFEARVRKETGIPDDYPINGLTLGIRTIMHARHIVLVAKGKHKAEVVKQVLEGPISTDTPASVLQLHPNCEFLLDADAASELALKD